MLSKKLFVGLARLIISVLLLVFALSRLDIVTVLLRVGDMVISAAGVIALFLLLVQLIVAALRQMQVFHLAGTRLGFIESVQTTFIGAFFGQALATFIGGDAMRVWRLHRLTRSVSVAASGVIIDRMLGLLGLASLVAFSGLFIRSTVIEPDIKVWLTALSIISTLALACIFFLHKLSLDKYASYVGPFVANLWTLIGKISRHTRALIVMVVTSALVHVLTIAAVIALGRGAGISIEAIECLILIPPVVFLAMLPISYSGWGIREGAMVIALGLTGISPADSMAISIGLGITQLAASLPGAILWLAVREA